MMQSPAKILWFVTLPGSLTLTAAAFFAAGCQTEEVPEVFRGHKLRTEVLREEATPYLKAEMLDANLQEGFAFELEHWQTVRVHEQNIHQKMHVYADPDDINREHYRYVPVPDEEMPGETVVRTEKRRVGPLADERVRCRDTWHETDSDGIVTINPEQLLRPFDDLRSKRCRLEFSHPDFGTVEETVTREQLLDALGVDTARNPRKGSNANGLKLKMTSPETAEAGGRVTLRLHARNQAERDVYDVRARVFSSVDWLDGINFYIGRLQPGESREFQRSADVPADQHGETVFAQVGVRHAEGALEKPALKIILRVEE